MRTRYHRTLNNKNRLGSLDLFMRQALQIAAHLLKNLVRRASYAGLSGMVLLSAAAWGSEPGGSDLPVETQREFAIRFAPSLVFGPDEAYFPCDPFRVDGASFQGTPTAQDLTALRNRAENYRGLSLEEKMARAALFFRAYRHNADGIVVEYWTYYVKNAYGARPLVLPIKFGTSHPNDLEHIFLVLRLRAGASGEGNNGNLPDPAAYEIGRILASAHNISNVFSFPADRSETDPIAVIVESGSHAMAPDVNRDTRFDPKEDSDRDRKMIWGIRDRGATFARYRLADAAPRPPESAVVLYHAAADAADLRGKGFQKVFPYQLVHQDYLEQRYRELEAASKEWPKALGAGPGWIKWLFGEPQSGDQLLLPSRHENFGRPENMADRRVLRERGFTAGITTMMERNVNMTLGGRWAWPVRGRWTPDLMWDSQVFVTCDKTAYLSTQIMGFYPVDAMTNIFAGWGLIVDPANAGRRQLGFLGGFEFRLGRFRIHNGVRQVGPLYKHAFDFRLSYLF